MNKKEYQAPEAYIQKFLIQCSIAVSDLNSEDNNYGDPWDGEDDF